MNDLKGKLIAVFSGIILLVKLIFKTALKVEIKYILATIYNAIIKFIHSPWLIVIACLGTMAILAKIAYIITKIHFAKKQK